MTKPTISILYTNIGRGHPFYLDGIVETMARSGEGGFVMDKTDVFAVSRGPAAAGWRLAHWLYHRGSSGGLTGSVYGLVRSNTDYNRPSLMLRIMGRDIVSKYRDLADPLLVAHPSLVGMLAGRPNLIYQHGELVAPRESIVKGAATVIVPTSEVASVFGEAGYDRDAILVSGLCIEPALIGQADDAYRLRMERYSKGQGLTGAFFSSGAEPAMHVERLVTASLSHLRCRGKVVIFAGRGGRLDAAVRRRYRGEGEDLVILNSLSEIPSEPPEAALVDYDSRRVEEQFCSRLFANLDFCVAPSHERSNWALGLGMPMFILMPTIGPFAPLNCRLLRDKGVAEIIDSDDSARSFGEMIIEFARDGSLAGMASAGWGKYSIDGFERIVQHICETYQQ
ncbi:MAG: hypothetical protein JSU65_04925 [Candidatus Zixiibacteriota bacterium]|nr:MAG: hypothetical protein JSU65_04925 [candidate division Zixibacteria bacterium]